MSKKPQQKRDKNGTLPPPVRDPVRIPGAIVTVTRKGEVWT